MKKAFVKLHGCGNDYLFFSCSEGESPRDAPALARRLCPRHTGVGADGIVLLLPSTRAQARMRIFNADGSEAEMCGNAIRCAGKLLYESGRVRTPTMTIETRAGIRALRLFVEKGRVTRARVDMGPAALAAPPGAPVHTARFSLSVGDAAYPVTCVNTGNPHCVVFCREIEALPLSTLGPQFERHPFFPRGVNTEFVQVLGEREFAMRVWERGSGETLACGTGACAAVAAAVHRGLCQKNEEVTVALPGGRLTVQYTEESMFLTGPAAFVFRGEAEV